jgi:LmbE family N-acetylglucosaminyl deacetylase
MLNASFFIRSHVDRARSIEPDRRRQDERGLQAFKGSTDCTLTRSMVFAERVHRAAVSAALAGLIIAGAGPNPINAQENAAAAQVPASEPTSIALPLPEDRGQAALEQVLRRLRTTASVMMIVAHPDDEDGALLTTLSRGLGVRTTLFTLTRGEGGQNAMSADTYDALGIIRTNELLKAGEYYGADQLWGTEADFGFSKTLEESFARWGHDRVLYDAVLAVRRARPQVLVATFAGAVSDGHGQHQVSGEIAQEVFKAAGDAKVFPEQLKDGLEPWQPLAVYSMVPFAPITDKGMFDYATGKWAPAKFKDYVTGEWTNGELSSDVTIQVGTMDPALGRNYVQIAREGWGHQKSQNGGANPTLSGPATTSYHLWAAAAAAKPEAAIGTDDSLFHNKKVEVDTSIAGLARLAGGIAPAWLVQGLNQIDAGVKSFEEQCQTHNQNQNAHSLAPLYKQTLDLYRRVKESDLSPTAKAGLALELGAKSEQFQAALDDLLGLDMMPFTTTASSAQGGGPRGASSDETPRSVTPGEEFKVRIHTSIASPDARLTKTWLENQTGESWTQGDALSNSGNAAAADAIYRLKVPQDAKPTEPYFTRPSIEQPYYDVSPAAYRGRSFAPWPLAAWAEFSFDGVPIHIGKVVQTMERVPGEGGVLEPLVVTPSVGVHMEPEARILPLDGSALPAKVTVHAESGAEGMVDLKLPAGWKSEPAQAPFHLKAAGDTEPLVFSVTPAASKGDIYSIRAVAHVNGKSYETGWKRLGYPGLPPYNQYRPAQLSTRKVDVKVAPGLRVGYVMGTGDLVPEAIEELGVTPHLLSAAELASSDLSAWNVILIGIRAYSTRPELAGIEPRLEDFVRNGGTVIVQYQSANFPAPLPLSMGRTPERVVDEQAPVKLLDPSNPLLSWPNTITTADFAGWVEERGHSFLDSWDPGYTALTETGDAGQDPQRGGLVVAHPGKGTYIYISYALYRQLPELVPGSYRLLANLLSAGLGRH